MHTTYGDSIQLEFKRFLLFCREKEQELVDWFKTYKLEQVFFELVPTAQPNVIKYNSKRIKTGVVYLFDMQICGSIIPRYDMVSTLWKSVFYDTEWDIVLANSIKTTFLDLIKSFKSELNDFNNKYKSVMLNRKRDFSSVKQKDTAKIIYKSILEDFQYNCISLFPEVRSCLGSEKIEGIVCIDIEDRKGFKIVDINGFSKDREDKWKETDNVREIIQTFKKDLISRVFNNSDVLLCRRKREQCVKEYLDYATNGSTINSIRLKELIPGILVDNMLKEDAEILYEWDVSFRRCVSYLDNRIKSKIYSKQNAIYNIIEQNKPFNDVDKLEDVVYIIVGPKSINRLAKLCGST